VTTLVVEEVWLFFLGVTYLLVAIWLSIYGFNAFVLLFLYFRHRRDRVDYGAPEPASHADFPLVTVQMPIYNEKYVVHQAIDALVRLDWPRDRLQIQVLDDSTDETTEIARQCVEAYRQQGMDIELIHRTQRSGYKAGALNEALEAARGPFVALFDADFRPPPDFLRRTVSHLAADPALGFVQARWGHLNDEFSLLALAQAMALDGHFVVEHTARQRAGLLTNFSGTGGVWRRACIEACGGWRGEMLTEDMDLSYRAQLAGWKGLALPDVVVPAELPVQLAAFKRQQFRWAKGNTQCLLRQVRSLMGAPLPLFVRIQGLIHLSYYLAHPLMLVLMLCTLPLIWHGLLGRWSLTVLSAATFGPPLLYVVSQWAIYAGWWRRLRALPVLICLGMGLALNTTAAVIEAVLGIQSAFQRTPKYQIEGKSGSWRGDSYALSAGRLVWGEILLTVYALLAVLAAVFRGNWQAIPFLLLYVVGFGYVSTLGLVQSRHKVRRLKSKEGRGEGDKRAVTGLSTDAEPSSQPRA
jgi:cellulose synthase/poly-beta-1,6-N-acetylglucosamine synthase-like glycosyltransferase